MSDVLDALTRFVGVSLRVSMTMVNTKTKSNSGRSGFTPALGSHVTLMAEDSLGGTEAAEAME